MPTQPKMHRAQGWRAPDIAAQKRAWDRTRPSASQRGYTVEWRWRSKAFIAAHPFCKMCEDEGRLTAAQVVDHIIPHRGDMKLFWDIEKNWQPLCATHHNSTKQRAENAEARRR